MKNLPTLRLKRPVDFIRIKNIKIYVSNKTKISWELFMWYSLP
jgi:hypothetical protein